MLFGASFLVYLLLALVIDAMAKPRGRFGHRPLWSVGVAVLALTLLYAGWFSVSWRPIFSAVAALVTLIVTVWISDYKYRNVLEPLNFMDFALIAQIWRHPLLYRAEFLHHPVFFTGVALLLGIIVLWCGFVEPSILPAQNFWMPALTMPILIAAVLAWLFLGPLPHSLVSAAHRRMLPVDAACHVRKFGFAASLVTGLIGWRQSTTTSRDWPAVDCLPKKSSPIVLVVQSESFVDLRGCELHDVTLPALYEAQTRSVAYGRLTVPVQGAWTLRSEYVFLTGYPLERFGFDLFHPYLRLRNPPRTIAHHLRDAGFSTIFIHPFDMSFFRRDTAMPKLGFNRLFDESEFAEVEREGYYISDTALAKRILSLAAAEAKPFFCFAATMENHNPWDKNRLPGVEMPVDQFVHHLRNADRMIAHLIEGIEQLGRPAVLAFYGDHVPTMPELADPFPDPRTDYFVMGFRDGAWLSGVRRDLELHNLSDLVLATLGQVCGRQAEAVQSDRAARRGRAPTQRHRD